MAEHTSPHGCDPRHLHQFRASPDFAVKRSPWQEDEGENVDPFLESQLLFSNPHLSQETPQSVQTTDLREESNNAKPPARTDFPVIEDGNNKTKDRFLPSRNYLFIAAKATQNSRQTFYYFPPTVWKYGKRKSCHDFSPPAQFYQK